MKKVLNGFVLILLIVLFGSICFAKSIKINDIQINVYKNLNSYQPNEVIGMVWRGESYLILDTKTGSIVGKRFKIKLPNGLEGWVPSIYCDLITAESNQESNVPEIIPLDSPKISAFSYKGKIIIKLNDLTWIVFNPD